MTIENVKASYQEGDRVCLVEMFDNPGLEPGLMGTVMFVDNIGTIHVKWDNGRHVGILNGFDKCRKVTTEKVRRK